MSLRGWGDIDTADARNVNSNADRLLRSRPPSRRLGVLLLTLALLFAGIMGRLIDLQVIDSAGLVAYGESQRMRSQTLPASRGSILDRSGAELALSIPAYSVIADPRMIDPSVNPAAKLASVLELETDVVQAKLDRDSAFEYLSRQVNLDIATQVRSLKLDGIYVQPEPKRIYPAQAMARSIVGQADIDGLGISGLEAQFDDVLTGDPGELFFERSLAGVAIPVGEHESKPARAGDSVRLSLDRGMQFMAEEILQERIEETEAQGGTLIVMVPGTGEILAMANMSRNKETSLVEPSSYNRALIDTFAPGSVMKLVTLSASLEEGLSTPDRLIEVPYGIEVGGHLYQDSTLHGTETWPVSKVLVESSNVGAIRLGMELGRSQVAQYVDRFGFGKSSGLNFPGESSGVVRPVESWHGSDIAGVIIGTGVGTTALQVLSAYNVIANKGVYVAPRLVDARIDADGQSIPLTTPEPYRVISEATSSQMAQMLGQVVTEGTGTLAAVPGYNVAGKTGTAWKMQSNGTFEKPGGGRDYMATFVGFAPLEDPRVSVIVVLDGPRNVHSGGSAAAPAFSRITEHALTQLDIAPSEIAGSNDANTVTVGAESSSRLRARAATANATNTANVTSGGDRNEAAAGSTLGRDNG